MKIAILDPSSKISDFHGVSSSSVRKLEGLFVTRDLPNTEVLQPLNLDLVLRMTAIMREDAALVTAFTLSSGKGTGIFSGGVAPPPTEVAETIVDKIIGNPDPAVTPMTELADKLEEMLSLACIQVGRKAWTSIFLRASNLRISPSGGKNKEAHLDRVPDWDVVEAVPAVIGQTSWGAVHGAALDRFNSTGFKVIRIR